MAKKKTSKQSKGGKARARSLTPEERSESASKAARARWDADIPVATHEGDFNIGNATVSAAVLPNGKRLLTQATFLRAIGRSRSPKAGTGVLSTVDGLPFFLQADALKPFITEDLMMSTTPIFFKGGSGRKKVGYDAELLPMVAEVYLQLRDAAAADGKSPPKTFGHIIEACDVVMRGLARIGILALVDEATGYQEVRDRHALQKFLDDFMLKEFAAWAKRFPDEFYKHIFRLRGWEWKGMKVNRPQIVAHYTKDFIYARLAPGVLTELQKRNPMDQHGRRKAKHHQFLTEEIGHPALAQHMVGVLGLMRISTSWDQLLESLDIAFPKRGDTLKLPYFNLGADEDSI